jgi:hypothetical protein
VSLEGKVRNVDVGSLSTRQPALVLYGSNPAAPLSFGSQHQLVDGDACRSGTPNKAIVQVGRGRSAMGAYATKSDWMYR